MNTKQARIMASSSSTTASSSNKSMASVGQEPLKCPRCDSSNTKFCYYNNYSLSQPRHFCKACKRYWTRGGTLRNVPVGGGCRKNNRVKRPPPSNAVGNALSTAAGGGNPSFLQPCVDLTHSSSSLLYNNLATAHDAMNSLEFSFPFSGLNTAAKVVSSDERSSAGLFDIHHPRVTDLGIGFSSSTSGQQLIENGGLRGNNIEFRNGLFSGSSSIFDSPNTLLSSSSSAMASLLIGSTGERQKDASNNSHGISLKDYSTERSSSNLQDSLMMHYQQEEDKSTQQNGFSGWNSGLNPNPYYYHHTSQFDHHHNPISDHPNSSSLLWNTSSNNVSSSAANGFDPSNNNIGSSVPSLI